MGRRGIKALNQIEPVPRALAALLDADARTFGVHGMAVAVVTPGRCAFHLFGVEAPESTRLVGTDTWFSLASVAKHATALATLALAQEGLVDITAPIGRYLGDLPPAWADRGIDSLMRHTSGLPEYLSHVEDVNVPDRRDTFLARYGGLEPVFAEGEGWLYSNTNYILLAFLVAHVRKTSFAADVQRIVDRLEGEGIAIASPRWTREANLGRLGPRGRDEASMRREVIGDGDLSLTVLGAATWLEALLSGAVLAEPWRSRMWSPALLASGRPAPYGCGWFVERIGNEPICHHAGHYDGWSAMAYLAPARGAGVIAMCNLAPGNTRAMRYLAQKSLEAMAPGSTPLALAPIADDVPALTATARTQLLRDGDVLDRRCFADELLRVASRGGAVRNVINVWAGSAPLRFDLVEEQRAATHRFRRYRLAYPERTEHLLVGTTPEDTIFWAWPL